MFGMGHHGSESTEIHDLSAVFHDPVGAENEEKFAMQKHT
jgi:hypothetical protein